MKKALSVSHVERNLSRVLEAIEQGDEVLIMRGGEPVARLVPAEREDRPRRVRGARRLGLFPGAIKILDDDRARRGR